MAGTKKPDVKKPMVKSGPVYTPQTDTIYDMDLKRPNTTIGDLCLLAFCAWNFVLIGAVLGQWVSDMFLWTWFLAILIGFNIVLLVVLGSPFLWGQYFKRDMKVTMKKMPLCAAVFVGSLLVFWGVWILVITYSDTTPLGLWSSPFPEMAGWQTVLYWIGLCLTLLMWSVVEAVWWNVAYDGLSNGNMVMRLWGAICSGACFFCLYDCCANGAWAWFWMMLMFLVIMSNTMASFFIYDFCSLGGAIGFRVGFWMAWVLIAAHVQWQWWGLDAYTHQFTFTAGNLFNLGSRTD